MKKEKGLKNKPIVLIEDFGNIY